MSQILLDLPRLLAAVAGLCRLGVRLRGGRDGDGGLLAAGNLTVLLLAAWLLHVASIYPTQLCID